MPDDSSSSSSSSSGDQDHRAAGAAVDLKRLEKKVLRAGHLALDQNPGVTDFDLAEDMKTAAAKVGFPYDGATIAGLVAKCALLMADREDIVSDGDLDAAADPPQRSRRRTPRSAATCGSLTGRGGFSLRHPTV